MTFSKDHILRSIKAQACFWDEERLLQTFELMNSYIFGVNSDWVFKTPIFIDDLKKAALPAVDVQAIAHNTNVDVANFYAACHEYLWLTERTEENLHSKYISRFWQTINAFGRVKDSFSTRMNFDVDGCSVPFMQSNESRSMPLDIWEDAELGQHKDGHIVSPPGLDGHTMFIRSYPDMPYNPDVDHSPPEDQGENTEAYRQAARELLHGIMDLAEKIRDAQAAEEQDSDENSDPDTENLL